MVDQDATEEPLSIIYVGTSDFAASIARRLLASPFQPCAYLSQPDRKQGRGRKLTPPALKRYLLSAGVAETVILQPESIRNNQALQEELNALTPDLIVTAAYGKILPPWLLELSRFGALNVHASILPRYRGAAPIQRAIMAGDLESGVSLMVMDEGLDTGPVISQAKVVIDPNDSTADVALKMAECGAVLLIDTLQTIHRTQTMVESEPQPETGASYAAMIEADERWINWRRNAREIHNQVRALFPDHTALASVGERQLKVEKTVVIDAEGGHGAEAGTVHALATDSGAMLVQCGNGLLAIERCRPQSRGSMSGFQAAQSLQLKVGDQFIWQP